MTLVNGSYEYHCVRCGTEWSGEYAPVCDRGYGRSCIHEGKSVTSDAFPHTANLVPGEPACLEFSDGEHLTVAFVGLLSNEHGGVDAVIRWRHSDGVMLDAVHWSRLHPVHGVE